MANSTSTQRTLFAPACSGKGHIYAQAYAALDAILKKHNYAPRSGVTGAYNCRKITGGSGYSLHSYGPADRFTFWNGLTIATSLAVDINWDKNPYGPRLVTDMPRAMVDEIEALRSNNGMQVWRWGGYYAGNKDGMHFEIVCGPADLAKGVPLPSNIVTIPANNGSSSDPIKEDEDMKILVTCVAGRRDEMPQEIANRWWFVDADTRAWCPTEGNAKLAVSLGVCKNSSPIEVSPTWLLEKRPVHPIDDAKSGSAGGKNGHYPVSP